MGFETKVAINHKIRKIIDKAPERRRKPGDYEKDGLLYCGKCNEPKQIMFGLPELEIEPYPVFCSCKCEQDEAERKDLAEKKKIASERIETMRKHGLVDEKYILSTFTADDKKNSDTTKICKAYVENWDSLYKKNTGLMLYGPVGSGKSFFAACIANALIDKGVPAMFTTISTLSAAMNKNFSENRESVLKRIASVPLLIIDDIGTERDTAFGYENLYDVINARYKANKPLIITTNLTLNAIKEVKDVSKQRIYSRISEMCIPVLVDGKGRRLTAAKTKYEEMKQLGIL